MSKAGIKRFLDLVNSSKEFATLYNKSPAKAVMGFDLSEEEKAALVSKSDAQLAKLKLKVTGVSVLTPRRY